MTAARLCYIITAGITFGTLIILLMMGRNATCPCGWVDLWGTVGTSEGSQQLLDWYTPSHLLHGLIFYAALWLVARRMSVQWRLVIATAVECAWEIGENTDAVIQRYREATISLDYYGDSVLNSASDIAVMFVGFWLARVLPLWTSLAIVVGFELLTTWVTRDGLALNVLMLLAPSEAILEWQAGS